MALVDYGRSEVVTAGPDEPIADLARTMDEENVGSVVITEGKTPVGIVTDRDLAIRGLTASDGENLQATDVLTPDPVTVENDMDVFAVTAAMYEAGVRRAPIVEDGDLVGIVTLDDLTLLLVTELGNLRDVIAAETPPY